MSTAKLVLVLLVLFIALAIVGRMDYEEAKRVASANAEEGIRPFCVRFPVDGSGERSLSDTKRATAFLVTVDESTPFEAPPTLLRCVVVEE